MIKSRRGFTIVELMLVSVVSAALVVVTTTLYAFIATRTSDAISQYNSLYQSEQLLSAIDNVASNAIECKLQTISASNTICCTLPADGDDFDGDGVLDSVQPSRIGKMMKGEYDEGKRVWFYSADATGRVGSSGNYWFRATRDDDSTISDADIDRKWSFVNSIPRIFIAGTVTFSQSAFMSTVRVNLDGSQTPRESETALTKQRTGVTMRIARNMYWKSNP